jgi:hypothetical protein
MKNSNRRFYNSKCEIFESLSQKEVQRLCYADIIFTQLEGFLFLRKTNIASTRLKIARQMLIESMKEALYLSQN